ncbi:hypothetical protein BLNAU_3638 [Blattamonas nauphoetae]|uniref:Uncharacterized protein n=1 Tax=Blattamonas nauphoetae TaxID=2049346 RepID=A0ABQ9YCL7_9EUKA|nr:hypothetical protein BLNAU_3638 [Blattamonas nauphoetae]
MILDPFCSFSGEDFTPEAHGFCISGAKSYLQCADRTRNFPEVPKEYLRLVGHSLAGALVARSVSLQYFFPDFSEDYLHFVLYVEKASLKYFTLQRQQIDGPLDPKKQSKKFKPPEHDSTFEEPLWISIENDRVYAILARFYSPPPPYPHIPLLPSFSFLNGTRNPNLVLKLIRIRSESYVLVQQHFVRPPLFPDQQLFASCLYSVNKYTTALMEMTSEKTEEAKHENTIITDRINTLWQSTQQDSRDEHNPDIFSHGSPSLSMSGSQAFNLSLPLSQLLQIAAPFLTIETEIINSISKKYLDTLSLVDLFVLREMNTRKHQVFVPFVTATTDPIQSHSFVETINSISSYLTQRNQTNPNNGPDIPTKEVVNILHKSTAKDILVQHSQSNLSSPQYTFRAHQSSYSQSTLSSSRSATTTNQVTSLSSLITSHSLIFAPYKDLIFMTHPTHFTLILDFAPQHPPTVSLCLSNSVLFKSLPKSSRPLDPLTTHFTAEKFGFGQSQRTTVLFQSNDNSTETPLNSPMSLSSFQTQNTSKPQPHMYFPFHIHTIPHHPPSSVHSSNPLTGHSIPKSFFSGKSLTRSRIFNVPHERKTNTSYLDLSTSSFFDQSIASSVSQTADPPLASSLILSYATDASPETIFPTIPSSDQTSQSLTLPTSSTRSRPTHTKNTPSPLSKLKTFFSRRRKDQLDDDFLFHHTSLHSVPDSVIRTLFPGQQEEKNLEPRKSIVPSRMVSSSTLMESPLSHSSSPMSQSTISLDSTPLGFKQRSLSPPSFIPHPLATITASPPLRYAQAISQYHAERKLHKNFEVEDKLSPETKSGTTKYSAYPSLDDAEMNIYQPTVPLNYTFDRITQTDQFEHFLLDATTGIVSQYHFNFRHIVESLTNLTPNTVTTLLHILLIHLNDTNLTRVLLRRYFLNSNVTMAPSIFHEILLALPFRALLEKEAFASMTELGQVLFTTSMRIQNLLKVGNIIMGRGTEGERYGVRMEIRDFAGWNGNNRDSFIPSKTGIGEKGNSFHYLWKLLNSLTLKVIDEQLETNTEEDRHHQLNNLKNYLLGFSSSSETDKKEEGSKLSITEPISVDDLFSPLSTSDENRLNWNDTEIELQKRRRNRRTDALYEMEDRIHTTLLGDQSLLPFSSPRRHHHFLTRGVQPMLKKGIAAPLAVDQNPNNALNDLADFIESMIFLDERSKTEKTSKRAVSFVVDGTSPMSKSISAANDEISDRDRTLAETFKHEIKEAIEQRKRERMEALFGVDDQPLREPSNPLSTPDRNTSNPKPHPFLIFNLFTDQPLEQMPSHGLSQFIMQRSAEKLMKQRHPNSHNGRLSDSSPRHGIFPASSPTLSYVADNVDWDAFEENLSDDDRSSDASLDLDERPSHQTAPPNQPKPGHAMMEMFEAEKTSERQHAPSTTVVGSLNSACEDPERRETDERMPLETDEESSADSKSDSSNDSDDQSPTVPSSSVHLSSSPELPDPNGSPLQTHRDSLPHQSHHPSTRIATTSISDIPLLPPSLEDSKVYHDEQIRRSTDYFYMLDLIATNTRDDESKYHNYAQPSLSPMIARELSPRAPPRTQKPLKSKQSILSRRHPRFESFPSFLSYFASLFLDVEESNGIEAVKAVISHVRHRKREKELIIRYLIALKELRIETSPSIEERTGQNLETICNLFPTSWLQLLRHNLVPYSLSDLVDAIHQNGMFTMSHASSFPPSMPTFSPFNSFKIIRIGTITDKSHPYVPLKSVISPTARYFSPNVVFVTPSYFNLITPFHQNLPVDSSLPYSLQTPIRAPPDDSLVTPIPNPLTDI